MDKKAVQFLLGMVPKIQVQHLLLDALLTKPYAFEERLVYVIDAKKGTLAVDTLAEFAAMTYKPSIKVQGYEKLSHVLFDTCQILAQRLDHHGPVTCHMFLAKAGGASFPVHSDPDDVVIHVVGGRKTIYVGEEKYELEAGDSLFIPYGVEHRAVNNAASVMLSFGLERFIKDKLNDA